MIIPSDLWGFFLFGLGANIIASIIVFIITVYKASSMDESDAIEYIKFAQVKYNIIKTTNTPLRIIISKMLFFIPGYYVMKCIVYIMYTHNRIGLDAIINGVIAIEKASFISLMRFNSSYKKKNK